MASTVFRAERADRTVLFACADPEARFVTGKVCDSKLAALLAPYSNDAQAIAALTAAGATLGEAA